MSKVAFVVSGKSPTTHPGGLGAYAYNTAKILNSLGYDTYIVGFSSQDEIFHETDGIHIAHVATPFNRLLSLGLFFITPYLVKRMQSLVAELSPTEVVVYSAGTWGLAGVGLQSLLAKQPLAPPVKTFVGYFSTFEHDSKGQVVGAPVKDYGLGPHLFIQWVHWISKLVFKPIEHYMLRRTDQVVVHYESTRRILLAEVKGLPAERILKIPYYVDLYSRTSELKFPVQKIGDPSWPTVSVICRQDPRKGINSFLKAVAILVKERKLKFNCLIVGAGIFAKHNRSLAKKLGIDHAVHFLGFVESVEAVLNATDIYVLPSVEEGSGAISLLEAMKKGVAIVTTYCDGIPEDFYPDQTAVLVRMNDPEDLARGLERVITQKDFRESLARSVRKDYQVRFQFEKMRQGVEQLVS